MDLSVIGQIRTDGTGQVIINSKTYSIGEHDKENYHNGKSKIGSNSSVDKESLNPSQNNLVHSGTRPRPFVRHMRFSKSGRPQVSFPNSFQTLRMHH